MSQLLSLPPEILLQIIDTIPPEDLESFCQCCKALMELAKDALKRHASMKAKYSEIYFGGVDEGYYMKPEIVNPVRILREILKNDRYACYPERLTIGQCDSIGFNELIMDQWINDSLNAVEEVGDEIRALLSDSVYLNGDLTCQWNGYTVNDCYEAIKHGCGLFSAALAITLLPNLRSMTFTRSSSLKSKISQMLISIIKMSLHPSSSQPIALNKLSEVHLDASRALGSQGISLLQLFALLTSMRRIHATKLVGKFSKWTEVDLCQVDGYLDTYLRNIEPQALEVTEIALHMCSISVSSFAEFLTGFKALKRFTYEATPRVMGSEIEYWNPVEITSILHKHASHSLENYILHIMNVNLVSSEEMVNSLWARCKGSRF